MIGNVGDRLALVQIPPDDAPDSAHDAGAGTWTYLGVAHHDRSGSLTFAEAGAAPECIVMIEEQALPGCEAASRSDCRP